MTSLTSFPQFALLPKELQLMCWEWAFYALTDKHPILLEYKVGDNYEVYCRHSMMEVCKHCCEMGNNNIPMRYLDLSTILLPHLRLQFSAEIQKIDDKIPNVRHDFPFQAVFLTCHDAAKKALQCLTAAVRSHEHKHHEYAALYREIATFWYANQNETTLRFGWFYERNFGPVTKIYFQRREEETQTHAVAQVVMENMPPANPSDTVLRNFLDEQFGRQYIYPFDNVEWLADALDNSSV